MKFWSSLENEYNDILGENQEKEDEEISKEPEDSGGKPDGETAFQDMLSEFNSDLKTIPKDELFPTLTSGKKKEGKSELVEESEFDAGDARRALKSEDGPKKHDKKCKVGDKSFEIGERWTDEKTGKEMICILMNIPTDVQPSLMEAGVMQTVDEPAVAEEERNRPSVEPQWSYTAHPKKKCKSDGEENKDMEDNTESKDKNKTETNENKNDLETVKNKTESGENKDEKREDIETAKNKTSKKEKTRKERPTTKGSAKSKGLKTRTKKKVNREKYEKQVDGAKIDTDTDSDIENQNERVKKSKDKNKKPTTQTISKKAIPKEKLVNEPTKSESSETSSNQEDGKSAIINTPKQGTVKDDVPSKVKEEGIEEDALIPSGKTDHVERDEANETNEQSESKGEPIYMKETIVKRRKLLRTEETIQTTTTDKTSPSK